MTCVSLLDAVFFQDTVNHLILIFIDNSPVRIQSVKLCTDVFRNFNLHSVS